MKEKIIQLLTDGLYWLLIFLTPAVPFILAIGLFVALDFITAIWGARKNGESVTSRKMRPTVRKFIGYGIGLIVAHIVCYLWLPDFPGVKCVGGLMAYIELKSLNENLEKITGLNIFKILLDKLPIK